jgi:hypothetical protein
MPIPRVFVARFFQLVTNRRFAEAERILERIKLKIHETEWNRGYFQALQGIVLATKSNDDQYVFLSNVDTNDENELKRHRREFLKSAKDKLHADYDRGFFSAWADYIRALTRLKDAERGDDQKKTKQSAGSGREETIKKETAKPTLEKKIPPKTIVQTKLG